MFRFNKFGSSELKCHPLLDLKIIPRDGSSLPDTITSRLDFRWISRHFGGLEVVVTGNIHVYHVRKNSYKTEVGQKPK